MNTYSVVSVKQKNIPFFCDKDAFYAFVERVTQGKLTGKVEYIQKASESGYDEYELSVHADKMKIVATSGTSAGTALNAYLQQYCKYYFGIMTTSGSIPDVLPDTKEPMKERSAFHYRYAFNYCTFGYTYAFHTWEQWERVTDYLILAGYNLVLNPIANECVWLAFLQKFGYTYEEAKKYISAPNYLPWQWMMNMSAFESEYFEGWFDEQRAISVRFNRKLAAFGMAPVVTGYCGAVPADFGEKYPSVRIIEQGKWGGFVRPAILHYEEPLFEEMATTYYALQREILGGSFCYFSVDPFHEGGRTAEVDLPTFAKISLGCMKKANPNAVWLLQGWQSNPKRTMLTALPKEDALIVNLHADKEPLGGDDFCGYPHIYCVVNNFGGQQMIRGSAIRTYTAPIALAKGKDNVCVGIGMIPEGVECDEYLFDILSYLSVKTELSLSFEEYVEEYFTVRYQKRDCKLAKAWSEVLKEICYEDTDCCHRESALLCRPSLTVNRVSTWAGACEVRENKTLHTLAKEMLARYQDLQANESYRKDLVAVYRQSIADRGWTHVYGIQDAYKQGNLQGVQSYWVKLSKLFALQAELVECDKNLNLQLYLDNAMQRGKTQEEKDWLCREAKRLITLWGDEEGSILLHDYAAREYGDLLRYFYKPRWEMFVGRLIDSLQNHTPLKEIDWYVFESAFVAEKKEYNREISNDLQITCLQIIEFWKE